LASSSPPVTLLFFGLLLPPSTPAHSCFCGNAVLEPDRSTYSRHFSLPFCPTNFFFFAIFAAQTWNWFPPTSNLLYCKKPGTHSLLEMSMSAISSGTSWTFRKFEHWINQPPFFFPTPAFYLIFPILVVGVRSI